MADYKATASGNWSTMVWSPVGTPGVGDSVWANGYTVTLNQDVDLGSGTFYTRPNVPLGAASGGGFVGSGNRIIVGNIISGTTACMSFTTTSQLTLIGNTTGGTTSSVAGLVYSASNSLSVVGNFTGGTGIAAFGLNFLSSAPGFVTGNFNGGSNQVANGGEINSTALLTVIGNGTGGSVGASYGIRVLVSNGSLLLNGIAIAGTGGIQRQGVVNNTTNNNTIVQAVINTDGYQALEGRVSMLNSNPYIQVLLQDLNTATLTDGTQTAGLLPAEDDVREGVQYNLGGNEGTLAVPPKASVLNGVPTDDGVGEFTGSDPSALAEAILQEMQISAEPIAERLRNSVTQEILGDMLDAALP